MKKQKRFEPMNELPYKSWASEEWKRAKKLRFTLNMERKPSFRWQRMGTNHVHGRCNPWDNWISLNIKFREQKISEEHFRSILRHELAHLKSEGGRRKWHGEHFMRALEILGGSRYSPACIKKD